MNRSISRPRRAATKDEDSSPSPVPRVRRSSSKKPTASNTTSKSPEKEKEKEVVKRVRKTVTKKTSEVLVDEQKEPLTTQTAMLTASKSHKLTRRQPTDTPNFTLQDLRNEIKDLFVRPLWKTMYYVIRDVVLVSGWFFLNLFCLKCALFIANTIGTEFKLDTSILQDITWTPFTPELPTFSWASFVSQTPNALISAPWSQMCSSPIAAVYTLTLASMCWNYVYWQGHFFTGLLIIAHECGHKALFDIIPLGHFFGWVFHSFLFIPYFSWSFSHRNHHTFNKNQAHDEAHVAAHIDDVFPSVSREFGADYHPMVKKTKRQTDFYPSFRAFVGEIHENLIDFSFLYRVLYFVLYATIGFPLYLIMNASNRKYPDNGILPPNHFDPNSLVFHNGEGLYVILSNIGLLLNCAWIYYAYQWTQSLAFVSLYYFMPYLHCHFYFVVYTLCHHSSPSLPTYSGDKWNYLQGAMSTIDRTHGPLIDNLWHYISRTHVIHHIFSDLPFYNSWEATERLKPILGDYYMFTDEDDRWFGAIIALWNHVRDGTFIAEDDHAGLVLVATAHETAKKFGVSIDDPLVQKAVEAKLSEAIANDPHKDGRNVEKEIFWQRTLQY
jgi:omega-6 fatty acid desaturase (delta-12 desaturase)